MKAALRLYLVADRGFPSRVPFLEAIDAAV